MKKIIAILIAAAMVLALAGCGGSSSGGATTAGTTAAPETTAAEAGGKEEETTAAGGETASEQETEEAAASGQIDPSWEETTFINAMLGISLKTLLPEGEWEFSSPSKYPSAGIVYKVKQEVGGEEVSVSISTKTSEKGWQLDSNLKEENGRTAIKGEGYEGTWLEFNDRSLLYDLVLGDWPYDENYGVVVRYEFPISYESEEAKALDAELKNALLAAPVLEEYDNGIEGLTDESGVLRFSDTISFEGEEIALSCKAGSLGGVIAEYEGSDGATYKLQNYSTSSKSTFDYQSGNADYNATEFGGYAATESVKDKYVEAVVNFDDKAYVDFKCDFTDGGSSETAEGLIEALVNSVTDVVDFDEEWISSGLF